MCALLSRTLLLLLQHDDQSIDLSSTTFIQVLVIRTATNMTNCSLIYITTYLGAHEIDGQNQNYPFSYSCFVEVDEGNRMIGIPFLIIRSDYIKII